MLLLQVSNHHDDDDDDDIISSDETRSYKHISGITDVEGRILTRRGDTFFSRAVKEIPSVKEINIIIFAVNVEDQHFFSPMRILRLCERA